MSAYVKKIQFKLHESYGNPLRGQQLYIMWLYKSLTASEVRRLLNLHKIWIFILVVTKPPYEITETGWGEFEIIIKIFFIDPNERPVSVMSIQYSPNELPSMSKLVFVSQVTLYHLLKLFQSDSNAMPKKTVVSEFYDEMVFLFCIFIILNNLLSKCNAVIVVSGSLNWIWFYYPTFRFSRILLLWCSNYWPHQGSSHSAHTSMKQNVSWHIQWKHNAPQSGFYVAFNVVCVSVVGELEQRTKEKLEMAKKKTSQEITELKDKLKASRENINHLKAEIRKLEEDSDHKEHWEWKKTQLCHYFSK